MQSQNDPQLAFAHVPMTYFEACSEVSVHFKEFRKVIVN